MPGTQSLLTDEEIKTTITQYFKQKEDSAYYDSLRDKLITDLLDKKYYSIKSLCTNINSVLKLCFTKIETPAFLDNMYTTCPIKMLNTICDSILNAYSADYLANTKQESDVDSYTIMVKLQSERAMMEHMAFELMHQNKTSFNKSSFEALLNQFKANKEAVLHLGFIEEKDGEYSFCNDTFCAYFCARFLISCLKNEAREKCEKFEFAHSFQAIEDCTLASDFIKKHNTDIKFKEVWLFMAMHPKTEKPFPFDCKPTWFINQTLLIQKLQALKHSFSFKKTDHQTITISWTEPQSNRLRASLGNVYDLFILLKKALSDKFEKNIELIDNNTDDITITAENKDQLDKIYQYLLNIKKALINAPKAHAAFFSLPPNKEAGDELNEVVECTFQ